MACRVRPQRKSGAPSKRRGRIGADEIRGTGRPPARSITIVRQSPAPGPDVVWMADEKGAVTFVNRKWRRSPAAAIRDELGNGWAASVHPDDLPPLLDAYHRAVVDQRPVLLEYRLRRSDGLYRRISDCTLTLYEDDGEFVGYVGTCVDVTGQREGTAALERTVEHLRLVATHATRLSNGPDSPPSSSGVHQSRVAGCWDCRRRRNGAPLKAIGRIHPDDRAGCAK